MDGQQTIQKLEINAKQFKLFHGAGGASAYFFFGGGWEVDELKVLFFI